LGLAPSERERVRSGASPFWRARNARQPYLVALGLPQRMRARAFAWALRSWTDMAAQRARAASRAAFLRSVGDRAALRAWPPRLPNQARYAATAGVRFMPRILPRPERQREKGRGGGSPMIPGADRRCAVRGLCGDTKPKGATRAGKQVQGQSMQITHL